VEIEFLEEHHLQKVLERECSDCGLGAMKQLKRDAESGWSEAHAALARVTYPPSAHDGSRVGWLLYIKPTLRGREPADVLQYHAEHQDFPQQTTGDQFFDEAQWESYRRLGECIGRRLFQKGRWPFEEAAFRKLCGDGEKSLGGPEPPEPSV
jgi:hypothetical protein